MDDGKPARRGLADDAALDALLGEVACGLIGAVGDGKALDAHFLPGFVHHGEHVVQATIDVADKIANCPIAVAEAHHAGRTGMDAELVFQRGAIGIVARAQAAICVDEEFRHQEQRDATRALRRVRKPGEDEVNDVLRHVMIAPGDEDLLAVDAIGVTIRHRTAAHGGKVGACLRLRQIHRAGPFAADQLGQIGGFEFVRGMGANGFHRTAGQHRAEGEGHVGGVPHLRRGGCHQTGQALAAEFRVAIDRAPAVFNKAGIGVAKTRGWHHATIHQLGPVAIAGPIERGENLVGHFPGFFQHGLDQLGRGVFVAGQRHHACQISQFGDGETHVTQRGGVVGHGGVPRNAE